MTFVWKIRTLVAGLGVHGSHPSAADSLSSSERPALCTEARAWVASHPRIRPKSLREFTSLPAHYQRALFNSYNPAERAALWRQHFARYTSTVSRLNQVQKSFIDSIGQSLESFIASNPSRETISRFALAATLVLGRSEAKVVFGKLGVYDPSILDHARLEGLFGAFEAGTPRRTSRQDGVMLRFASHSIVAPIIRWNRASVVPQGCSCHTGGIGDFCDDGVGPHQTCMSAAGCNGIGCGWLFLQTCNGNCQGAAS